MTTRDFEKCIAELMKVIYFKKKKYNFVRQINDKIFATSGFGYSSHQLQGTLFVHPTIGICNKAVDDLFRQLMEIEGKSYFQPIINTSIGYLTPDNYYKEWMVTDDTIDLICLELIDVIKMYGLPFIEKYQDPDELLKCVEDRKYILSENRDYDLPILYYLNGDKQKGVQYIEEYIENSKTHLSDDEIKKSTGYSSEKNIIIRTGENENSGQSLDDLAKKIPSGGSIVIVGSGYNGIVSSAYLKYYKNYKLLK